MTDEIPVEPAELDQSLGGTIVINASDVLVRKFEKGVGRKAPRGGDFGTVNVGKAVYTPKL